MFHKVYSYLYTDFYHNFISQFIEGQKLLNFISNALHNLKQYIRYTAAVTAIVNNIIECHVFYFRHSDRS
jgi:hypothetical protein